MIHAGKLNHHAERSNKFPAGELVNDGNYEQDPDQFAIAVQ
jgi:hypothetical protein